MLWLLIHIIDLLLWFFIAGSVGYVVFFSLCTLLKCRQKQPGLQDSRKATFLVLIPAYHEDNVILNSVQTFLQQDYPQGKYQVVVISDHMQASTNSSLAQLPITLLQPSFAKSSKARALQHAMAETRDEHFTHVVILDADNIVSPDFLTSLSRICSQGYAAIQCHRTAKNSDNDIAVLDGISEEINNTLFRRAHNNIGLSSALIGSGMCFDYEWFCQNVGSLTSAVEDRELESLLAKQRIFVKYEADIHVMDEKVSSGDNFQRQRLRWMTGQIQALLNMLPYIPKAIATGNITYIDKTIQQALIPRSILLLLLPVMAIIITMLAWPWGIKWWVMLLCFCLSLLIAIPSQLRTRMLIGKLMLLPSLVWRMLKNILRIDKSNNDFIHTTHHTTNENFPQT